MLDFKEEISKYKPIRTIDDNSASANNEIQDIMDLLKYISGKTTDSSITSSNTTPLPTPVQLVPPPTPPAVKTTYDSDDHDLDYDRDSYSNRDDN